MTDDPFELWSKDKNAPNEEELHSAQAAQELYTEKIGEDGEVVIEIHPSPNARMMAATIAGQFKALIQTGEFNRDEALRIVLKTMSAVVIHTGDDDEDDE